MKTSSLIFVTAFLTAAGLAAEPACAQTASAAGDKAVQAGMEIANQGGANGVAACASCHGAKGEGNVAAKFPRIAGQSQTYLAKQLTSYANGSRANPVMMPIAKALTSQQIQAVSAYYAGLSAPWSKPAAAPSQKRGETLANIGDEKIGVQACINCHGPGGIGEPPTYPYLAGQHGGYLAAALGEWKNGTRNNDPTGQMGMIAKRLGDKDIAALSAYYASQPAPPPAAQRGNTPRASAARPAVGNPKPQAGSTPVRGIGTEQGAPTGGGGSASGSGASGSKTGNAR